MYSNCIKCVCVCVCVCVCAVCVCVVSVYVCGECVGVSIMILCLGCALFLCEDVMCACDVHMVMHVIRMVWCLHVWLVLCCLPLCY